MKQQLSLRASVCLALATLASSSALAAGFQVNEHSANGLGRAMAGQAALVCLLRHNSVAQSALLILMLM